MIYIFNRFENGAIKRYEFDSYEQAKSWVDQEIEKFKIVNRVRNEEKDRVFISFKSELERYLNMQKDNRGQVVDDYLKCKSCKQDDHEGQFCRCETRNIRIAKERRSRNESFCSTSQPERLSEKTPKGDAIV